MTYTIKLNMSIDEDGICSKEEIEEMMKTCFECIYASVGEIEILDIND